MNEYPILYVDDEPSNLVTLRFSVEPEFQVITASSSEQALEVLRSQPVAVLLADQRMEPDVSGTELCARAKEVSPETIRMIVTAYGDLSVAVDAINRGQVRRFIPKPWDVAQMMEILREAVAEFRQSQEQRGRVPEVGPRVEGSEARNLVRALSDPATVLRHNLEWAGEVIGTLEPAVKGGGKRKIEETYRKLRSAITDSGEAVEALCDTVEQLQAASEPSPPREE
jgi:response regulator RpfG family c-di-GMP phosphodiesterase